MTKGTKRRSNLSFFILLLLSCSWKYCAYAKVACESDAICINQLREGSQCVGGFCTNPFVGGCLRQYLGEDQFPNLRVCNSEDPPDAEANGWCTKEPFRYLDYPEIRIAPSDWDSSVFLAMFYQVLLTELMNVPVTIERGNGPKNTEKSLSFYDIENQYLDSFPVDNHNLESLATSNEVADCRTTTKSCAHIVPEVWRRQFSIEGLATKLFTGQMGIEGFWIPSYTIEKDPSLGTYLGLKDRKKVANLFKRPTTWGDYCTLVSNCTVFDGVAVRAPNDDDEAVKYFVEGLYTGHFRSTEKNDCTTNSDSISNIFDGIGNISTCSGHVVDYPCSWSPFTEQQMYWNDIALESDNAGSHYGASSIKEIMYAANATQSDVIILWRKPEPTFDQFDYVQVVFPFPTAKCVTNRRPPLDRCTSSYEDLIGTPEGACNFPVLPLEKLVALSLQDAAFETEIAIRSPAYQFVTAFTLENFQVEEVLRNWYTRNKDRYGYDPREAICAYIGDHIDDFMAFVPPGYPREIGDQKDQEYYTEPITIIAVSLAGVSILTMLLTATCTVFYRKHRVMNEAQVIFLYLFCFGYFLVSIGALLHAMLPSDPICVATEWMVHFGYTTALAPMAVKVAAINRLLRQAKKMRRHEISKKTLYTVIFLLFGTILVYLTVWTILDKPYMTLDMTLRTGTNDIVDAHVSCKSTSRHWDAIALGWEGFLIFYCFFLAWDARRQMKQKKIPELRMVGNMAYVSFMIFVFRSVVFYLPGDTIYPQTEAGAESIILSIDSLLSILVYFGPKFLMIFTNAVEKREPSVYSHRTLDTVECPTCSERFIPTLFNSAFGDELAGNSSFVSRNAP